MQNIFLPRYPDQAAFKADHRWFKQNRRRKHRIRPPSKIEQAKLIEEDEIPEGFEHRAVVRKIGTGYHAVRFFWCLPPWPDDEETARGIFKELETDSDQP